MALPDIRESDLESGRIPTGYNKRPDIRYIPIEICNFMIISNVATGIVN
jgi:hypothetical protein